MLSALLITAPPVIPYVAESPVVDGMGGDLAWREALVINDLRVIEPNVGFVVWVIEPRIVLPPSLVLVPRLRDAHAQDSSQNTP